MITILEATATVKPEISISLFSMVFKGGWLMIPIFVLSIIAIYIFFERYTLLKRLLDSDDSFILVVRDYMLRGQRNGATVTCQENNNCIGRVIEKGISYSDTLAPHDIREIMENSATIEISHLEKGLSTMATCAGAAPMIGFLGTVIGMVQAFFDMAQAGNNINIALLSRGIYTAMITTVAGLIVGIIAYIGYNILVSKIDKITTKLNNNISEYMEVIYEKIIKG